MNKTVKLNITALNQIDALLTTRRIPEIKLKNAINGHLGNILNAANDVDLGKILERLNLSHVDNIHFDKLMQRLRDYPTLKQDLIANPNWFKTFDDIIDNPEKFWDILGEGNITSGSPLAVWGQGHWWKNLRELANAFEMGASLNKVEDLFGTSYGSNISLKVTNNTTGEIISIVPDFLAFKNGKYHIVDAKYTSKSNFSVEDAVTPNQRDVFDWIKNQTNIKIEVRANNGKLSKLPVNQGSIISSTIVKIDILKSKQNDISIVESVINFY